MPKTLMLALTLLVSTALLTGQDYPQPGSSQTGTTDAGQTVPQGCFKGKESARMNEHGSLHAEGQSQTERHTRGLAKAKVTVQNSEAKPYDQIAGAALGL